MSDRPFLRIASDNPNPRKPACTTCLHYHPDTKPGFGIKQITWSWRFPFRHVSYTAGATSHIYAKCSYFGGHNAAHARQHCEGDNWEPQE